ncbi:MAG: tetratricopeptide repeat protein [Acidobacteriota bacterium]
MTAVDVPHPSSVIRQTVVRQTVVRRTGIRQTVAGSSATQQGNRDAMAPPGEAETIARQLAGDLDAIVLKALRAEPESRYRSAAQLADDLERYGNNRPVRARRGTLRYRTGKWVRRHRLAAAMATLALVLGSALVVSTAISANRLARGQERLLAEQATQQATLRFLLGIFEEAGPYVAEGVSVSLRDAVDRQADRVTEDLAAEPAVQAAILSTLGWVYLDLGVLDRALDYHQRALELRRAGDADSTLIAESLDGVAATLREQSRLDEAELLSAEALALHRSSASGPWQLLRSLNQRVNLLCWRYDWQAADPLSAEAIAVSQRLAEDRDPEVAKAMIHRAAVLEHLGQPEPAQQLYLESEALFAQRYGPEHPVFATLYNNLGAIEARAERFASAADYWRRADRQYAQAFGEDFYDRIISLTNLGRVLQQTEDFAGAEAALRTALEVAATSPALGPQHELPYYGRPAVALGTLLAEQGRCDEVRELLSARVARWAQDSDGRVVTRAQDLLAQCAAAG